MTTRYELTRMQRDVLVAFFQHEREYFLTGGAALVGYYLHHRETTDLDLFCTNASAFERGRHVLSSAAASLGATLQIVQDAPDFRRVTIDRGGDLVVVDLVHDRVPQIRPEKIDQEGVLVDPIEEIMTNKLTTLVSRMEERDLVDVFALERAGHDVESYLEAAMTKDGGCTPATLAWLLSQVAIADGARLPGGFEPAELRAWLDQLVPRLRRAAAPRA